MQLKVDIVLLFWLPSIHPFFPFWGNTHNKPPGGSRGAKYALSPF